MSAQSQERQSDKKRHQNNQAKDKRRILDDLVYIFGLMSTACWIVGGVFELDGEVHNKISLWLFCSAAFFVAAIAFCKFTNTVGRSVAVAIGLCCLGIGLFLQCQWGKDISQAVNRGPFFENGVFSHNGTAVIMPESANPTFKNTIFDSNGTAIEIVPDKKTANSNAK